MVYQTLDAINTSAGMHTLYTYVNNIVPIFTPLVLFGIFVVSLLGTFFGTQAIGREGNIAESFAVSGMFISIVATFMSFIPGMINLLTMVTCYGIAFVGFLWLIIDKN